MISMEEEVFKRSTFDFDKLQAYGFRKDEGQYVYSCWIMNEAFRADLTIDDDGRVKGKLYDQEYEEEYMNFRIAAQIGDYVGSVREEYLQLLYDIKEQCTKTEQFVFAQANRVSEYMKETYQVEPEFLFKKNPGFGVFRNIDTQKWFAMIMNINMNKFIPEDREVEVVNLKAEGTHICELVKKEGIYPAYHMNKNYWISVLLDDTLRDEEIIAMIEESYGFTVKKKKKS